MGEKLTKKINRILTIGKIKKHGMKGKKCTVCQWRIIHSHTSMTCNHCKSFDKKPSIKERISSMKRFNEDGTI